MSRWPLRWKIAAYAAALGVIATVAGAATTWVIMHYWEVAAFDRRLTTDAQELFRDIANFERPAATDKNAFKEAWVPLALRDRYIEILGPTGDVLYVSPNLPGPIANDGKQVIHTRRIDGHKARVGMFQHEGLTAFVGADVGEVNQIGRDIILGMIGAIPTVLIVVGLGGRSVARRALGPVEGIRQAAARIGPRNLHERLPSSESNDEIAGLVLVLNQTFDRLERSFQQAIRFSADASHHLKTPLTVMRAGIEEILTDPTMPPKHQRTADSLLHQVHQLNSISDNLLLLAKADSGRLDLHPKRFHLHGVLDAVCDDARAMAESQGIGVEMSMPERLQVRGDERSIALIMENLVENALKYNKDSGSLRIEASAVNGSAEVHVLNTGPPIPPDRIPHIFDRFYRARSDCRISGVGLGLSVACELAKANDGDLALVRSDAEWTEFCLRLPVEV